MDFSQLSDEDLDAYIANQQAAAASQGDGSSQTAPQSSSQVAVPDSSSPQLNLSPGANLLVNTLLGPESFLKGAKEGVLDAGRGLKQMYLQHTQDLGLQPAGTVEDYTKQVDKERKDYADNYLTKAMPKTSSVGQFVGNTAPFLAIPAVGAEGLGARILGNAALGGVIGDSQYVPTGDSRATNAVLGGAIGGAIPLVGSGLNKVINAIKGGTEDAGAKAIIDAGAQHNVPVFASDASDSPTLKVLTNSLEDVPILGTTGARADQLQKAQTAAANVVDKAKMDMLNTNFGGDDGLATLNNLAKSDDPIRGQAAQSLINDISNSGDDWQKIIEKSGNLKSFRNKVAADQKYSKVSDLADQYGAVPKDNTLNAVNDSIANASNSILPDNPLISTLNTIKGNLESNDLNYNQMRQARSQIGGLISDYYKGGNAITGSQGVGHLQGIKNAIDQDMNAFAQNNGPELKTAWQDADNYYKNNVIPYKDVQLAKALTNASPDEIYGKFITNGNVEGGKGTSRAQRFYNALDDKGQAAVRYGMVSNAFEKALNRDTGSFSPGTFASELDKVAAAKGVFFKGDAKDEIDGFKNLMRNVQRSKIATSKPETGIKSIPWIGAALGLGAHAAGASLGSLGGAGAGIYALRKILTTNTGRRLLLASSKLEVGNPALQKIANRTSKFIQRSSVVGGSTLANNDNSMVSPSTEVPNPLQNLSDQDLDKFIQQHSAQATPQTTAAPNPTISPAPAAIPQNLPTPTPIQPSIPPTPISASVPPQTPVTPQLLNKISQIESGNNPLARSPGSSASGLYQFTNGTWKEAVKKYGDETGITLADKNNPKAQRIIAQKMLSDNSQELQSSLGRVPKDSEIYLTHFLGLGGAKQLLNSNPNQFAARVLPDAARANRGMFFRNGKPLTVAELYQNIDRKVQNA